MAAQLILPTQEVKVDQLCCLVFGQPGSRKTSLGQTAANPITFAFDKGFYRAFGRKNCVTFDDWLDVVQFDIRPYDNLVVDTAGLCLDKLGRALIAESPKNGNRLGGLSLHGYGVLKTRFAAWVEDVKAIGKSLIFIAQEKIEGKGDESYAYPDIVGGSYGTLMDVCDLVGYMHFENGKKVIDFNPTDRWMAKAPPCGWQQFTLPDFGDKPLFLQELMDEAKASMGRISQRSAAAASTIEQVQEFLDDDPDLDALNAKLPELASIDPKIKKRVWAMIVKFAKAKGYIEPAKGETKFTQKVEAADAAD